MSKAELRQAKRRAKRRAKKILRRQKQPTNLFFGSKSTILIKLPPREGDNKTHCLLIFVSIIKGTIADKKIQKLPV